MTRQQGIGPGSPGTTTSSLAGPISRAEAAAAHSIPAAPIDWFAFGERWSRNTALHDGPHGRYEADRVADCAGGCAWRHFCELSANAKTPRADNLLRLGEILYNIPISTQLGEFYRFRSNSFRDGLSILTSTTAFAIVPLRSLQCKLHLAGDSAPSIPRESDPGDDVTGSARDIRPRSVRSVGAAEGGASDKFYNIGIARCGRPFCGSPRAA